jgi:tetratricopeptide (TPR) repeat protein
MSRRLILLFAILFVGLLQAQDSTQTVFEGANRFYEDGKYTQAIKSYESLLQSNYTSDDLHYNLANAYFKTNDIAQSILHYEKTLKLNPSHEDAAYNLKIANEKTIDQIEAIPDLFIYRWWKNIYNLFSMDAWAQLVIVFFFIVLFGLAIYFLSSALQLRKIGFYLAAIALFLALFSWVMADRQKNSLQNTKYAIIMEPTVNINSSPSAGSSKLFVLHEGTKVKVDEIKDDWFNVSLPNGNKGWIKKEFVEGV